MIINNFIEMLESDLIISEALSETINYINSLIENLISTNNSLNFHPIYINFHFTESKIFHKYVHPVDMKNLNLDSLSLFNVSSCNTGRVIFRTKFELTAPLFDHVDYTYFRSVDILNRQFYSSKFFNSKKLLLLFVTGIGLCMSL